MSKAPYGLTALVYALRLPRRLRCNNAPKTDVRCRLTSGKCTSVGTPKAKRLDYVPGTTTPDAVCTSSRTAWIRFIRMKVVVIAIPVGTELPDVADHVEKPEAV